jgi:hypothetical protein
MIHALWSRWTTWLATPTATENAWLGESGHPPNVVLGCGHISQSYAILPTGTTECLPCFHEHEHYLGRRVVTSR